MRRVALVSAHFPPSNLVGVHRARLWARHLPEFGWAPTVVTAHWRHYQEPLDWRLLELVGPETRVIRTQALGVRIARLLGNMALRSLWWTRRALVDLVERGEIDFMHIIVPDHFSALLGPLLHASHGLPYGIDYMDPWVHARPGDKPFPSKAWVSCLLSHRLEPWAVKSARLVTGVSRATIRSVLERNPAVENAVTAEIPMASSEDDYRVLTEDYRPETRIFDPDDGKTHIAYLGTVPPSFDDSLRGFLSGLKAALADDPFDGEVRVWLIGTGTNTHGPDRHRVRLAIESAGLADVVREHPARIAYTDALWHMRAASLVVVLGSAAAHYTPSKVYQALHSKTPVLALLPGRSDVAAMLRSSGRGVVIDYPGSPGSVNEGVRRALLAIGAGACARGGSAAGTAEPWSARSAARRLAEALDQATPAPARQPGSAPVQTPGARP